MRKVGQDRAAWTSSPPEPNVARELERLRDEDSVLEVTASGGGGTFEVTGAIPEFTGVPAGLQQFYVSPLVVDGAVNMTDTAQLFQTSFTGLGNNLPFAQDLGNTFDSGTASLVGTKTDLDSACVYNFANDSFGSVSGFSGIRTIRLGPNFSVAAGSGVTQVYVIQNGVISLVTLTRPAGVPVSHSVRAAGISSDGTKICSVWHSVSSPYQIWVGINNTDGTAVAGYNTGKAQVSGTPNIVIDNGWILFTSSEGMHSCRATETLQNLRTLSTDAILYRTMSNNVSDDGYMFYTLGDTDDLYRANLNTGVVSVYPEVFARYVGGSPTKTHDIVCFCMHAISATKVVFGGDYRPQAGQPDAGTFYPIYCAVVIGGGGANVSDSIFTEYASTSGGTAQVYAITSLTNGDVAYAILTPAPYDDFLVKVTGP